MGEKVQLWNDIWLKKDIIKDFPQENVVNKDVLDKFTPIITFRETCTYAETLENDFEISDNAIVEY